MVKLARWIYTRVWILPRIRSKYRKLNVKETFQTIYATRAWGDQGQFCSGSGSANPADLPLIVDFIRTNNIHTVTDLGCGDFRVGGEIVRQTAASYIGVDIVPELVDFNQTRFGSDRVHFENHNLVTDQLPRAELCLVRQVLQHLSNDEIEKVLQNLKHYRYALVSEHVPVKPRKINFDKVHGPDVRAYYGSGVYIDREPFNRPITRSWELPLEPTALLRVTLLENIAANNVPRSESHRL